MTKIKAFFILQKKKTGKLGSIDLRKAKLNLEAYKMC